MKKLIIISTVLLFVLSGFTSCKKDDDSAPTSTSDLNNAIVQGQWRITLYNDSGNDETSHFTGYQFQFDANGIVTAAKTGSTVSGAWTSGMDDSQLKLILDFGATVPFDELNDDWHVTEQTSTKIKLEDVSGGGSGTDYLTFEKN